jgi:hypothetical protein
MDATACRNLAGGRRNMAPACYTLPNRPPPGGEGDAAVTEHDFATAMSEPGR